jgi:acyl-CoA dehydrogenase
MDFSLSPEQREIQELALKFARNEMIPRAQEYDEKSIFPSEIFKKAWELVWLSVKHSRMVAWG